VSLCEHPWQAWGNVTGDFNKDVWLRLDETPAYEPQQQPRELTLEEKVMKAIVKTTGADEAKVTPEASLRKDLKADMLDMVELVLELEEAFGITIPDRDALGIRTVGQVIQYVSKRVKKRK
jgi:acyl carrier protein